jgi:glucokinase
MSPIPDRSCSLVADIGGTNIRIALADSGRIEKPITWPCSDFSGPSSALNRYLGSLANARPSRQAAIAVASPVDSDQIDGTNLDWSFSTAKLQQELGLERLLVVNDFAAQSVAVPHLTSNQTRPIKQGVADATKPCGLVGPGTGLGVSGFICVDDRLISIESEGGHQDLAASNSLEWSILKLLAADLGHVSAERVLSGPGLVNLYRTICDIDGTPSRNLEPSEIIALSSKPKNPRTSDATKTFSSWLGAFAGDLALTLCARGGIYIGGGVVPKMGTTFDTIRFNDRFLDKGRLSSYLEPIPVSLILDPYAALYGLSRLLLED